MFLQNQQSFIKDFPKNDFLCLSYQLLADLDTPLSLFLKLNGDFLLESVEKGIHVGKYSIVTTGKNLLFEICHKTLSIKKFQNNQPLLLKKTSSPNPLLYFQNFLSNLKFPPACRQNPAPANLPFLAAVFGYIGYEAANNSPKLPQHTPLANNDPLNAIPDASIVLPRAIAIYDNIKKLLTLTLIVEAQNFNPINPQIAYQQTKKELFSLLQKLEKPTPYQPKKLKSQPPISPIQSNCSQKDFLKRVEKTIQYIHTGEIIQTVLSQRFSTPIHANSTEIYRSLKSLNPSPYLFLLNFHSFQLVGSSPEVMLRIQNDELLLKPIAGTRKRGNSLEEDQTLKNQLLNDEKEIAEHLMLVDLGRNDLGKIATTGSVTVENFMQVEQYSHVQHLVSTIKAKKNPNDPSLSPLHCLQSASPAGTLSGAPKLRAMQIIHQLEQQKRGPYGGSVFYLGLNNNLDSCITIRSMLIKKNVAYVQAGAGIVAASNPLLEFQECQNKAKVLFQAIQQTYNRLLHNPL